MNPLTYLKLGAAGVVLAALVTFHLMALRSARIEAKADVVQAIMAKTEEVSDAAERARMRVLLCIAVDGMQWNSATRECQRVP